MSREHVKTCLTPVNLITFVPHGRLDAFRVREDAQRAHREEGGHGG